MYSVPTLYLVTRTTDGKNKVCLQNLNGEDYWNAFDSLEKMNEAIRGRPSTVVYKQNQYELKLVPKK
jgi:hypothetical protein